MRLNHLDILEQCFRDKFFGYNKEDVDSFLHLVAEDFKEMAKELEQLKKTIDQKALEAEKFNTNQNNKSRETNKKNLEITPSIIKEKAKRIINAAREHADQHKKKVEHDAVKLSKQSEVGWFAAEHFFSLGLLGTVFGLCVATATNLDETAQVSAIVAGLKTGLNTAFYTTICGIVFSLPLQAQLMILRYKLEAE